LEQRLETLVLHLTNQRPLHTITQWGAWTYLFYVGDNGFPLCACKRLVINKLIRHWGFDRIQKIFDSHFVIIATVDMGLALYWRHSAELFYQR
jgi:hypothetical protein